MDVLWQFNETVFSILVYGALTGTVAGLLTLIYLIFRDRKEKKIW